MDESDPDYWDWVHQLFYYFRTSGRPLRNAEFLAYWSDPNAFAPYYEMNMNYGGDGNLSYYTTFFEIY